MPRQKKNDPRNYVISMRVSDAERLFLEELTRRSHQSLSDVMRDAMMSVYARTLENSVVQR
jgi:hypothetical protein